MGRGTVSIVLGVVLAMLDYVVVGVMAMFSRWVTLWARNCRLCLFFSSISCLFVPAVVWVVVVKVCIGRWFLMNCGGGLFV